MTEIYIDGYGGNYQSSSCILYDESYYASAQSFTGKAASLTKAQFYVKKFGSPGGNVRVKLYKHTGTYGTNSSPIGPALATSDAVAISVITSDYAMVDFTFTGAEQYRLQEGVHYCIGIFYEFGGPTDYLMVGLDNKDLLHSGSYALYSAATSWETGNTADFCFAVFGDDETSDVVSVKKPLSCTVTKEINGPWTAKMQIEEDDYIRVENYNRINDELYISKKIRKIKDKGRIYYDVELEHNMSELADQTIERFYIRDTVTNHLTYLLAGTNWSSGTVNITATLALHLDRRAPVLEALYELANKCGGELNFNSVARTVDLKSQIGTITKLPLRYDKNCDYILKEEDSSELITRLYAFGPDNQPINSLLIQNCDDSTEWTCEGTVTDVSVQKMEGSGCLSFVGTDGQDLYATIDALDLSGYDTIEFWVFNNSASAVNFTAAPLWFGIGETNWYDNTVAITGTLQAYSWKKYTYDISGIAVASRNAIIKVGFESGGNNVYVDGIRAVNTVYIDSTQKANYKVNKEAIYQHTTEVSLTQNTINLYPTADAYVKEAYPSTNYKDRTYLLTRDDTPISYESFMKFSLASIPPNATITVATLNLYCYNIENGGCSTVEARVISTDWSENILTWNSKPSSGAAIASFNMSSTGAKSDDVLTEVNNWFTGSVANYGFRIRSEEDPDADNVCWIYSSEAPENRPYLQITYTLPTSAIQTVEDGAQAYLLDHDEPKLKYTIKMADLSRAIVDTWEDDTIDLGDTVRVYDSDLGINVDCRVKKITKDLLNPLNTQIELTNRAYSIVDTLADFYKRMSYLMPYKNNPRVADANAMQQGYLGGNVG